ncbi:hypothetical protein TPHA_0G03680 [Tetrapisispora phaffii CBS 4417]|uniref:3',5'-cyclic-nucleotide phosphodiesterase n=1 Tax=Tetrapisispora phaffii (strain ATCC 24235 / CBS 4417 / NBRC 1672 / NRRL Y-8282 / UCD 70-5) TaxID=1071381 RepID=G8BWD0_TETPH|nr:hypothetical protein TPHA_0G03680 [Tetrapisispora phaffii CBS 4417]CCE64208.1 hypothetical protein TPHA_0G03680 [Tetrapisispora phaffii CBS 4417]
MDKTFEVTILGTSGGPIDGNNQSFMVRPAFSKELNSINVDGGVVISQIIELVKYMKRSVMNIHEGSDGLVESFYENDMEHERLFTNPFHDCQKGFGTNFIKLVIEKLNLDRSNIDSINIMRVSLQIYEKIKEYYVTHAHLDHISAIVLNTPYIYSKAYSNKTMKICGLPFVIDALDEHIFNDKIWPNLTAEKDGRLELVKLENKQCSQIKSIPQFSIIPFTVCHGQSVSNETVPVYSTVFVLNDKISNNTLVICGDLQHDPPTERLNKISNVWKYLADYVKPQSLSGIIIECSSTSIVRDCQLYGHLSPPLLIEEMISLRDMYCKKYNTTKPLIDKILKLNLIVTHVKMENMDKDPRLIILEELNELKEAHDMTNLHISISLQGYTYLL